MKSLLPHITAAIIFIILSFYFMSPVLEGKELLGGDTVGWMCMTKETSDYNAANEDVTLWTNSMFGGMPNYMITLEQPNNVLQYVEKVLRLFPQTVFFLLLYFLCFYILLLHFRVNPWLAIVGSIAFTFASYNLIIIAAGHNTKAVTIAYMAPLIGSIYLTFKDKKILGSLMTAFFLGLAIRANHIQILYYTLIILLIFGIVEFIFSIKEKQLKNFGISTALAVVAAVVALGLNATSLLTSQEYSKYTMRGESNGLTIDTDSSQEGLNKDYITQWSYGIDETMTLLIPNFKGGASGGKLAVDSHTGKQIAEYYGSKNAKKFMEGSRFNLYWGTQPFTSGPVYIGAVVMLLFVLGLFILEKRLLWWLVPMIILTTLLSWGKNFMWLTDIFIDYVPLYNKFRTVSMTLVAAGFGITLIAILALKEIFSKNIDTQKLTRSLLISTAITGGIALIFAVIPSLAGNFSSPADQQYAQQYTQAYGADFSFLIDTLALDRKALLQADAIRSFVFILLAAGAILAYLKTPKMKEWMFVTAMGVLILVDLMPVAQRYLNEENFSRKRNLNNLIQPTTADQFIMQDKGEFRVLNLTVNIFNDASPSYFHKNIGGYHAAKLRRYQELINIHLGDEIQALYGIQSYEDFDEVMRTSSILNMLNLKYLIVSGDAQPLINPYRCGNAWFVHQLLTADNSDDEMRLLGEIDTHTELVYDQRFVDYDLTVGTSTGEEYITLKSYQPNHLIYEFSSPTAQVAVFSEIYYDKGWNAYINGEKVPYFRANYLLRAMQLQAGEYEIEFKFDPTSYKTGNSIALISSIILVVSFLLYAVYYFRKRKENQAKIEKA